jgi:hypothetical protein
MTSNVVEPKRSMTPDSGAELGALRHRWRDKAAAHRFSERCAFGLHRHAGSLRTSGVTVHR